MLLQVFHRLLIIYVLILLHLKLTGQSWIEDSNHNIIDIKLPGENVPNSVALKINDKNSNPKNIRSPELHCAKIIRRNPERYRRFLKKRDISKVEKREDKILNIEKGDTKIDTGNIVQKRPRRLLSPSNLEQSINSGDSLYPAVVANPSAVTSIHANPSQFVATGEYKPPSTQQLKPNSLIDFKLGESINNNLLNQINAHTEQNYDLVANSDHSAIRKDIPFQPYGIYFPQDQNQNSAPYYSNNILQGKVRSLPIKLQGQAVVAVETYPTTKLVAPNNQNISETNKTSSTAPTTILVSTVAPSNTSVNTSSTLFNATFTSVNASSSIVNETGTANRTLLPVNTTLQANVSNVTGIIPSNVSTIVPPTTSGFVECPIDTNNVTAVLTKILQGTQDIQGIIDEVDKSQSQQTADGMPCRITGSWVSEVAGLRFDLVANGTGPIKVKLNDRIPPKPGLLNINWTMTGQAPMKRGMPFFLNGFDLETKQIASFCGLCKACGEDMIIGAWTFVRPGKNCRDTRMIVQQRSDVFRKEILHSLNNGRPGMMTLSTTNAESSGVNKTTGKRNVPTMWWTML